MPATGYPGDATQEEIEQQALLELSSLAGAAGGSVTISSETCSVLIAKLKEAGVELPTASEVEEQRKAKAALKVEEEQQRKLKAEASANEGAREQR